MSSGGGATTSYLHGDLDLRILEARSLPNMDMASENLRRLFSVFGVCRKASSCTGGEPPQEEHHHHKHHPKIITSDPYVTVVVAGATVARTRVLSNSENPEWDERFVVQLAHPANEIEFQVKDNDFLGSQLIGTAKISADRIASGEPIDDWFPIMGSNGKPAKPDASIHLRITFTPCDKNPVYLNGISSDYGVKQSHFPVRHGGKVKLYQDAHVIDGMLPEIALGDQGNVSFEHGKCWEDICHAILEAHHMVYIVGWSVYHKVKLVREPTRELRPSGVGDMNLGELLKYKSQEGVRVLLLVWDDKTSHSSLLIKTEGVMQTHDEETRKFFKHSSVKCVLAPRYASSKLSIIKQKVVGTLFTHHQKCVIVDSQGESNKRKITAFIGGLDLCDGRYDTPEHRLFRDLDTVFKDDFHNPTFSTGASKAAPRQPWHDLHCKIEGPAAYDVLANFEQRWRKAAKWSEIGRKLKRASRHWQEDSLLRIDRISWIHSPSATIQQDDPSLWVSKEDDPENWHVQVFRSIDSGSVKGFPKKVNEVEEQNLISAKNVALDKSIQTGYVEAIRSAQHFIYIENQYFLGSSYAWNSYKGAGADNLIPMELALKIASKIRAKERFAVYITIPMWPEGKTDSKSVQEILYWQTNTMQMMYEIIAKELSSARIENAHPTDYLNFYCLGNREKPSHLESKAIDQNGKSNSSNIPASTKYGRFMIYVHAKGMIVDDEYVIIGSANINQRSLAGSRDTEIAMGAYQPHYTWCNKNQHHPHGQVYGYRMSLWSEHMGCLDNCFKEPQGLECVRFVNRVAEENWKRFTDDEFNPLQGHLLKYPVKVESDGKISSLPDHENFPDVGGKVLGAPTGLPDTLTT